MALCRQIHIYASVFTIYLELDNICGIQPHVQHTRTTIIHNVAVVATLYPVAKHDVHNLYIAPRVQNAAAEWRHVARGTQKPNKQ